MDPAVNPVSVTEWDITRLPSSVESVPMVGEMPYETRELEATSVVQVIVAEVAEVPVAFRFEMTGPAAALVENEEIGDVVEAAVLFAEITA